MTNTVAEPRSAAMKAAPAASVRTVRVELGPRSYDIAIGAGLLSRAGAMIATAFPGARVAIVTDANVARLHLPTVEKALAEAGQQLGSVVLPPGEATKSFAELAPLCERLLALGAERGDVVLALGGGVIGDLAGFAASILRRGVRVVQMPTTLLAQVDSAVGGKTGINAVAGKNLIGAFHQPSLVLADTAAIATLPPRERAAGYAEVAKYGLLGDEPFFRWLEANVAAVLACEPRALTDAIEACCLAKAGIVARDERETGERALLNLGHTFGHALEASAGYSDRLLHGEAVAIGIVLAFRLSEQLQLCPPQTAARVSAHLRAMGLGTRIGDLAGEQPGVADMLRLMAQDKKKRNGRLTFILARGIGEAMISREVAPDMLAAFLAEEVVRPAEG